MKDTVLDSIIPILDKKDLNDIKFIFIWDSMDTKLFIQLFNSLPVPNKYLIINNSWFDYLYENLLAFDWSLRVHFCMINLNIPFFQITNCQSPMKLKKSFWIWSLKDGYIKIDNDV